MDVKLRNHLFKNLSILTRPVVNQNKPIKIKLGIEISQIISVDEPTQQVVFKLWTSMKWHNEFVSWKPAEWSNIKSLKVTAEHLWTPDITLYNDIDKKQESASCIQAVDEYEMAKRICQLETYRLVEHQIIESDR